jgi:hypothetical protein
MRQTIWAVLLLTTPLLAHDTWITPVRFTAHRGETIVLHMTSGMEFPKVDTAINRIASRAP